MRLLDNADTTGRKNETMKLRATLEDMLLIANDIENNPLGLNPDNTPRPY